MIALLYPCLYYVLEGNALRLTTASQAGAVSALVPLMVAVGARVFLSEHLSGRAIVGLLASIGGVAVLSAAAPDEVGARTRPSVTRSKSWPWWPTRFRRSSSSA